MSEIDCEHRDNDVCLMATTLCSDDCRASIPDESVCRWCINDAPRKKGINKATVSLAFAATADQDHIVSRYGDFLTGVQAKPVDDCNVGDHLADVLSWFSLAKSGSCDCTRYQEQMNVLGYDWCNTNRDQIASWLVKEYKERDMSLSDFMPRGFRWTARMVSTNSEEWVATQGAHWAIHIALRRAQR